MRNRVNKKKPYVVMTKDGDYYFTSKVKAQSFAMARNGFFDTSANRLETLRNQARLKREVMQF